VGHHSTYLKISKNILFANFRHLNLNLCEIYSFSKSESWINLN